MTPDEPDPSEDPPEVPDDDAAEERPEDLGQQSAASPRDTRKREDKRKRELREDRELLQKLLQLPQGRRFIWSILRAAGAFEERYGFGPYGAANQEATWAYRGQKDLGLRLYHSWSVLDRAGMLAVLDEHHPHFPRISKG